MPLTREGLKALDLPPPVFSGFRSPSIPSELKPECDEPNIMREVTEGSRI